MKAFITFVCIAAIVALIWQLGWAPALIVIAVFALYGFVVARRSQKQANCCGSSVSPGGNCCATENKERPS